MKIAIDCRFIWKSGIGTYIENLVDRLQVEHPEHQYLFICEKYAGLEAKANVEIFETDIKPFSLKELFAFPVSVINGCDAFFSPYINIPGGIKVPVYSTIHDCVFFDVEGIISPMGKWVRKWFYRRAIQKSQRIFTVSEFSKQRILYHFMTEKEIDVVYNGVSRRIKEYQTENCVDKDDYFIYVGNIKPHKGITTLITAFLEARKEGLRSKLLIVGNAEKFRTVDNNIYSLVADNDSISFTGWVSDEELIKYISRAKALVLPSLYEGFGIPPLEALYLGTPAIVSNIPVLQEIYHDLPVTFFKVSDVNDLKMKMMNISTTFDSLDDLRSVINSKFDFAKSAEIIMSSIAE